MKKTAFISLLIACLSAAPALHAQDIKKGDKLQTLSNLHPDMAKRLLYATNYQQAGLIPVCTDVTVTKINKGEMVFDYQGVAYTFEYDKHQKGAGVSFQDVVKAYFGPACDKAKMNALGAADKDGIRAGQPKIGMTKAGIVFAMGRPPFHANPNLDANYWLYWRNKFGKTGLEFDEKGKLTGIR
jgi:hypothetical protein